MNTEVKDNDTLKVYLAQIKYDTQEMESMIKAIEKAKDQMIKFKGKPKEETLKEAIGLWSERYNKHKTTFNIYIERFVKMDYKI